MLFQLIIEFMTIFFYLVYLLEMKFLKMKVYDQRKS